MVGIVERRSKGAMNFGEEANITLNKMACLRLERVIGAQFPWGPTPPWGGAGYNDGGT